MNLVARVPGYLESVNFKDGAVVRSGQLLFVIEQPPYEAQVALNEAALVRAQAELDRQQAMMKENATAETTVENWVSQRDQAKAQLELAQINLELHEGHGALRRAGSGPGRSIRATSSAPRARRSSPRSSSSSRSTSTSTSTSATRSSFATRCAGSRSRSARTSERRPVEVGLQNEKGYPHVGVLDFADNCSQHVDRHDRAARRLRERGHDASSRASSRASASPSATRGRCS